MSAETGAPPAETGAPPAEPPASCCPSRVSQCWLCLLFSGGTPTPKTFKKWARVDVFFAVVYTLQALGYLGAETFIWLTWTLAALWLGDGLMLLDLSRAPNPSKACAPAIASMSLLAAVVSARLYLAVATLLAGANTDAIVGVAVAAFSLFVKLAKLVMIARYRRESLATTAPAEADYVALPGGRGKEIV